MGAGSVGRRGLAGRDEEAVGLGVEEALEGAGGPSEGAGAGEFVELGEGFGREGGVVNKRWGRGLRVDRGGDAGDGDEEDAGREGAEGPPRGLSDWGVFASCGVHGWSCWDRRG